MKSKSFKVIVGIVVIIAIGVIVTYSIYKSENHNVYTQYDTEVETPPYSSIGDDGRVTIEGADVTNEETKVLEYFAANDIQAGVIKVLTSSMEEVGVPDIVAEYNPEYFYYVNTSNKTYIALFNDGELITDYEPVSE